MVRSAVLVRLTLVGLCVTVTAGIRAEEPKTAEGIAMGNTVTRGDLFGLRIDGGAERTTCRSLPFLACPPEKRGETARIVEARTEVIPVGAAAEALYLLGMINEGWDCGQTWWSEHPELQETRDDQIHIGKPIGLIEIQYAGGKNDRIPLVPGATSWFYLAWGNVQRNIYAGPDAGVPAGALRQPFASRPELMTILRNSLKLHESDVIEDCTWSDVPRRYAHFYLAVKPRPERIESIIIHDEPDPRGRPLVSGVTLAGAEPDDRLEPLGECVVDEADLETRVDAAHPGDWSEDLASLAAVIYNSEEDVPRQMTLLDMPEGLDAARIRFVGGPEGDWLSNTWIANIAQIDRKFDRASGVHYESAREPAQVDGRTRHIGLWYGVWSGIGTWEEVPGGIYGPLAFARTSEHYATLGLRCINCPERATNYVDFCDRALYFYRANHDPKKGPPNETLDISKYPKGAPPHWAFVMGPGPQSPGLSVNEIAGDEEMDGHGATVIARWVAWRAAGARGGDWLKAPRPDVYNKSRWDATRDAAEFICWLMDYTGRDVLYTEGEGTLSGGPNQVLLPKGMADETDPAKIKQNYANANWYEPYATYACLVGLRCSAQIADAAGEAAHADRWRAYAQRLHEGMLRLLRVGDFRDFMWRMGSYSCWPSFQESLAHAWLSIYIDGLDPMRWDPDMTQTSRNTLRRQVGFRSGYAPVQAMGYGLGWLATSAMILDEMDHAGPCLVNIARYSYDKNMDYVDPGRGIDWRKWQWLIPEGVNLMPDGRWYKIGDLTNGAHMTALHALELAAGVDDADPADLRILPRAPDPLDGLEVDNFFALVPDGDGLTKVRIRYAFTKPGMFELKSDRPLPTLSVRLGPYGEAEVHQAAEKGERHPGAMVRIEQSGHAGGAGAWWIWVEGMTNLTTCKLDLTP